MNFKNFLNPISASIILVVFLSTNLFSQDKIFLKSGGTIDGKIEEVGVNEVKYRKKDSPSGPIYAVDKSQIDSVGYADGKSESFAKVLNLRVTKSNTISFNLVPLLFDQVQFDYKRVFKGGKLGVSIPVIFRFTDNLVGNNYDFSMKWMTGLEFVLIPTGQKRFMYNLGIGVNTGQVSILQNYGYSVYDPASTQPSYYSYNTITDYNFVGLSINNSLEYVPLDWFSLSIGINLGANRVFSNYQNNYYRSSGSYHFYARPEIAFGFRF